MTIDLDALEKLAAGATAGPWTTARDAFTAAARSAVPDLILTLRARDAEIEKLREALEPFAEMLCGNEGEGGWGPNFYDEQQDDHVVRSIGTIGRDYAVITVGDLRRALAALSLPEQGGGT